MNVKKQLLSVLLICIAISLCCAEKSFITDEWKEELNELEEKEPFTGNIGPVITIDNQLLVQYENYYAQERRYTTYYLSVKDGIFWDIFAIDPKYEIKSIKKDNDKYYAILWNHTDSCLAEKSSGQNDNWERVLTFDNDNSKGFKLYAENGKVCIVSESKIYLNLDNTTFKVFDIPDFSGSDRIREPSIAISKNNTIYFGNDFGEWGGNLYKVVYDSKKETLEYTKLIDSKIGKVVVTQNDEIYCLLSSAHGLSATTALYKINDDDVEIVFKKTTYALIRPGMTFPDDSVDVYDWKNIIESNMIRDIVAFEDKLILLISNIGIYYINGNNELEKIKDLPFFEEQYTVENSDSPYNVMNYIEQLSIEDNKLSVIYRLPLIYSTNFSYE